MHNSNDYTWLLTGEYGAQTVIELLHLEIQDNLFFYADRMLSCIREMGECLPKLEQSQTDYVAEKLEKQIQELYATLMAAVDCFRIEAFLCQDTP